MTMTLPALLQNADLNNHEQVLKTANAALKKSKTDLPAQHVRLVALLQLDRFDEALRVVEDGGSALQDAAALECAYALYKNGKTQEAEKIALSRPGRGLQHVRAQCAYRAEDFKTAADCYDELARAVGNNEARDHEAHDLRINRAAIDAQLEWKGQGHLARRKKLDRQDLEYFETTYNAACVSLAKGEWKQGQLLLSRAESEFCCT